MGMSHEDRLFRLEELVEKFAAATTVSRVPNPVLGIEGIRCAKRVTWTRRVERSRRW
jgi:hypothetical protein